MFEFFEMPHFSHFQNQIGKMGHFKKFEHKKVGHFKKLARDQFYNWKWTENEILRFWGISKIEKMLSHDKILFQMLFGAFHDTSCTRVNSRFFEEFTLFMLREFTPVIIFLICENRWFSLTNYNLGLKMKNLKFCSIQPSKKWKSKRIIC